MPNENVLDIYGDKSLKGLVSIMRENPEYYDQLKDVNVDYDQAEELPESSFAYPEERALPINNPQMALLSSLYRNTLQPDMELPEHVDENLKKAEYLYDLKVPERKVKALVKKASIQEGDYLIPSLKKFPVRDKKEADFIQNVIVKNAHVMGYDHLAEACSNLVEKYASFKTPVEEVKPVIFKYAGLTLSNRDMLDASIARRKDFAAPEYHPAYDKIAEMISKIDFNREYLLKVASIIEQVDKEAGLRRLYDKHLLNPIEAVFNTEKIYGIKKASLGEFTPEHAERVTDDQIKNLLGEEVYSESLADNKLDKSRLVDVVNSLPNDMRSDFIDRIA